MGVVHGALCLVAPGEAEGYADSGGAGGLSFAEVEREIHEEPDHNAGDRSERHGMVIRSVREEPRDTCPQSTERHHEKQRPHPDDRSTAREIAGQVICPRRTAVLSSPASILVSS